jgi:hypothetical protein
MKAAWGALVVGAVFMLGSLAAFVGGLVAEVWH